jgi:hypothetical protein
VFTSVTLTLEPSNAVSQGTNVTVRCQALVSSSGFLNRKYTIYKDNTVVYTESITTAEDLIYSLRMARVANTGKYKCKVNIPGKELSSSSEKLTVTGWYSCQLLSVVDCEAFASSAFHCAVLHLPRVTLCPA